MRRKQLTCELQDLGGQVLHDSSNVDGGLGSDPDVVGVLGAEEPKGQLVVPIESDWVVEELTCVYDQQGTMMIS